MAEKNDCIACRKAQAAKHKHDKGWKIAAIVSSIIAILFIILYFGSGTVIETTEIENEVMVENIGGGNPTNSNIGNIQTDKRDEKPTALYIVFAVLGVAIIGGCVYGYFVAKKGCKKSRLGAECKDDCKLNDKDEG